MKKKIIFVFTLTMLLFTIKNTAYAYQDSNFDVITSNLSVQENEISPRVSDVIVYKYRLNKGILQYRRWNATRGYWVDRIWIKV